MTPRICAISISHKTASAAVRESLAVSREEADAIAQTLASAFGESIVIRTCGRFEVFVATPNPTGLLPALSSALNRSPSFLQIAAREFSEQQAIDHLLEVASGLHSPLPGEHHILGQVRSAMLDAHERKTAGPMLLALFRAAVHCGKRVRTETPIGRLAQTYASAAKRALTARLGPSSRVLVVGSGTLADEIARSLRQSGVNHLDIASRHEARGRTLAAAVAGFWHAMDHMAALVRRADVIVCCTSSRHPVITADHVGVNGQTRTFLDLGMPRNIDASIAMKPGVTLIDLDRLTSGHAIANDCIRQAQEIIAEERRRFADWLSRRRAYYARSLLADNASNSGDMVSQEAAA